MPSSPQHPKHPLPQPLPLLPLPLEVEVEVGVRAASRATFVQAVEVRDSALPPAMEMVVVAPARLVAAAVVVVGCGAPCPCPNISIQRRWVWTGGPPRTTHLQRVTRGGVGVGKGRLCLMSMMKPIILESAGRHRMLKKI